MASQDRAHADFNFVPSGEPVRTKWERALGWYPCRYPSKSQSVAKRWHPTALGIQDWKAGKLAIAGPLCARLGQCTTGALTPAHGPAGGSASIAGIPSFSNARLRTRWWYFRWRRYAPKRNSPDEVVVLGKLRSKLRGRRTKKALHRWRADTAVKSSRGTGQTSGWWCAQWQGSYKVYTRVQRLPMAGLWQGFERGPAA